MKRTKNELLRMAILGISSDSPDTARLLTVEDVDRKWSFLSEVGYPPYEVRVRANSEDENLISDSLMRSFMDALRWHNHYHS